MKLLLSRLQLLLLLCSICSVTQAICQVFPSEASKLHYRIIGFSFPPAIAVNKYSVEIAQGDHNTDEAFLKNIISTTDSKTEKIIAPVPYFNAKYTWRVTYKNANNSKVASPLHHFSTGTCPEVDSAYARLRIINNAAKYKTAFVFVDGFRVLYDMLGKPIWYMPNFDGRSSQRALIRDLKVTPFNTITFIRDDKAFEINYNGDLLWTAPDNGAVSGEKTEHYHHEFTRLTNGHYMILGSESVDWTNKNAILNDSNMPRNPHPEMRRENSKTGFGTIIEYDEKGSVVWSWRSSEYFIKSDLNNYDPKFKMPMVDVHQNAFYFDEKNKAIYVSFKNISRILKINYPSGKVLDSYGEVYKQGEKEKQNGLFCEQHCCRRSEEGYLYLFNNNSCNEDLLPKVMMMKEQETAGGQLKEVWSYQCTSDGVTTNPLFAASNKKMEEEMKKSAQLHGQRIKRPTSGGSVFELPDRSLFVCMNTEYSKIFIVDRNKNILWNAIPERYDQKQKNWFTTATQYRASIITDKERLAQLIWNTKK